MYICIQKTDEGTNALYYDYSIGRRRIYRQTYPITQYKGLKLFKYKIKNNAQKLCDYTNEMYSYVKQKYEVLEL